MEGLFITQPKTECEIKDGTHRTKTISLIGIQSAIN